MTGEHHAAIPQPHGTRRARKPAGWRNDGAMAHGHRPVTAPRKHQHAVVVPAIAATCAVLAIANLGGWLAGERLFISIAAGLPAMVPITTVMGLLTAIGLWAQRQWPRHPVRGLPWPAAVVVLALAIEACYLAGDAPAPFALGRSGHEHPASLSSPITAGMFLALGCALWLVGRRRWLRVAQGTAVAVFLVALLNLAGYLFRETILFRFLPGQGTAILTGVQLMLLALGVLFVRPRRGLMAAVTGDLPSARISRRLLVVAFVTPIATGAVVVTARKAGLYDIGTALPLFVWTMVVLLVLIIWHFALRLAAVDVARLRAERELHAAALQLREEDEHKDVFLASLAHELRNPLAPIGAAAEVLKRGGAATPEDRQRIGNVLAAQVAQIVDLVNDLMDRERVSSGRIGLERATLDLRDVAGQALDQAYALMERRRHACHADLPAEPVRVCGDSQRLVQIVANLLTNAAKYTPPGGTIRLRLAVHAGRAELAVEDNGQGIDAALLARLFEPYTQATITPQRGDGGLGLGLWLARRLADLHGGALTAASPGRGKGSTFVLALPLFDPAAGCPKEVS